MTSRQAVAAAVLLLAIAFIVVMRERQAGQEWSTALAKNVSGVFLAHGLVDDNLTKKSVIQRKAGGTAYTYASLDYAAPATFEWKKFEQALKGRLRNTAFTLSKSDQFFRKDRSIYSFMISRGAIDILSVKISRKRPAGTAPATAPAAAPATAPAAAPAAARPGKGPKVAIVLDDFGYNKNNLDALFGIDQPVTLSVLPNQRFSADVARTAESKGYEVILHLPLEPHSKDIGQEADTIRTGMGEKDVASRLRKDLDSVPGIDGVSNHMGSKATEDRKLMALVLKHVKAHNLFFFDSLTSERSVCAQVARDVGVQYGRRDIFLDNSNDEAAIEAQMRQVRDMAFARGTAIAIGHDRKNTVAVLSRMMPEMAREGIRFVYLSEVVD